MDNLFRFTDKIRDLDEFKCKRDSLEYMGDGGLMPLTSRQRSCIFGILKSLGKKPEDYNIDSVGDLTLAEASEIIDMLVEEQDNDNYNKYSNTLF